MKKALIITGITITSLIIIFLLCTNFVDNTSYIDSKYYNESRTLIDSLRNSELTVYDSVNAGFSKVSITPQLGSSEDNFSSGKFIQLPMAGYGARKGKSATAIHDSIFVKAVALKIGLQTIVFVSADMLIMPPNISDSVIHILSEKGIRREQIFFSATHSHSSLGGWGHGYVGEMFAGKENKSLINWLVCKITESVTSAIADLKPAIIGSGSFNADSYTVNRLRGESGTKNDDFSFIIMEQIGGRKAVIGSFSAHSTTLGPDNMEISADYPGYWERKIEKTSADIALFFAGSTGSQGPIEKGDEFEKSGFIGESLADSLNVHLQSAILYDKIEFSSLSLKMLLPEYNIRLTTRINLSSYLSNKLMPRPENVYLQAVRIGNMVWITTPCDFSGEYALQIKDALRSKGFNSNITSFNGSYLGYIVPGRYFYLNEYESKQMGWFGPNMGEYTVELIRHLSDIITSEENI